MASKKSASGSKFISGKCAAAVVNMEREGRKIQVFGRIKNGKIEIDHESLNELARKYPNANMSFVAVNAPFDPVPSAEGESL